MNRRSRRSIRTASGRIVSPLTFGGHPRSAVHESPATFEPPRTSPVGIVVPAVGIPKHIITRFVDTLRRSSPHTPYTLHLEQTPEPAAFNSSKPKNRGIRALMTQCKIIACTDIDMLIPPGLVSYSAAHVEDGTALWAVCRNIDGQDALRGDWRKWQQYPLRWTGTGSWIAMTVADWCKTGGWDERLTGWGAEDDVLAERRKMAGIRDHVVTNFSLMHVNHAPRQKNLRARASNKESNLVIGLSRPPRNWLTGHLPLDARNKRFALFVCASCNRRCPECSQRDAIRLDPSYQMSLSEIERFIECTKSSGYDKSHELIITGGEPLLWHNIVEGLRLLRQADLARQVSVFSNAFLDFQTTDAFVSNIDTLRLSRYKDNADAIDRLVARYGKKAVVVDRTRHYRRPSTFGPPEVLPAACMCEGLGLHKGKVYGCPNLLSISQEFGVRLDQDPPCMCDLQPGYMEILFRFPRTRHLCCRACVGNQRIRQIRSCPTTV